MSICPTMEIRFDHASGALVLSQRFDWLNVSYDSPTTVPRQNCSQWQIKISCFMFIIFYFIHPSESEQKSKSDGPKGLLVILFLFLVQATTSST